MSSKLKRARAKEISVDDTALCAKLSTNMSRRLWQVWVSPDIDYIEACPGLPIKKEFEW